MKTTYETYDDVYLPINIYGFFLIVNGIVMIIVNYLKIIGNHWRYIDFIFSSLYLT